ncbi:MAG: sugar phosphate isomerase/epimerase family protein [Armatimonadota bacterium]|nr:sugar phosphate isomerase/epimerase [bacterium]MDW8321014.1 sugar phosphate isomerase/epimerase family protein [Armatimonadota bacterium]
MSDVMLACNVYSYGKYRQRAFEHMKQTGIGYAEVSIGKPEDADEWLRLTEPYGIGISSVICPCDVASDGGAEEFSDTVKAVRRMGAQIAFVSVHAGDLPLPDVYRRLRRMGDIAAEMGVKVAMETHPDLITNGDVALRTMHAVAHPNVGINFDTANIYYYNEGAEAVTELQKVLPYVFSVHLKDTNGKPRTWYFPTLGQGVVNFPEIFRLLLEQGFRGPFTMELEGIEGENLSEVQQLERVAQSYAYVRAIVERWQQDR